MFSENNRISVHQMTWILTMEWMGKLCLLYPEYLAGRHVGSMVVCAAAGLLVSLGISRLAVGWSAGVPDPFEAIRSALCRPAAAAAYMAGFLYFFADAAVFLNLASELVQEYLLAELAIPLLVLPFAVTALCLCLAGIEVRGRFCEVLGPPVLGLTWLLIVIAAFGMKADPGDATVVRLGDGLPAGVYEVFACVDLFLSPMLLGSMVRREPEASGAEQRSAADRRDGMAKKQTAAVRRALVRSVGTAGVLCVVTAASYGSNAMQQISFSSVRVMGNVRIPGSFLQRWEVLFLVLLLTGLTVTAGGAFWYMRQLSLRLWSETGRQNAWDDHRGKALWGAGVLCAYFAAAGFLNETSSVGYYRGLCMHLLVPLFFLFFTAAYFQKKRRAASLAALLLVGCLLLTGCTARELEERLFPMALEFSVQDRQLVMTCAWNEGSGPGSKMEPGENSGEKQREEKTEKQSAQPSGGNRTVFSGPSLAAVQKALLDDTEQYVDYSHVEAVILDEKLAAYPELEKEVIEWMKDCPEFATSLILYPKAKTGLSLEMVEQKSAGKIGSYLESLYRNNEQYRSQSLTLGELLSGYYGDAPA